MVARRSLRSRSAILVASILGLVVAPGLAHAHTEFDYSLPADGASVGVPVDEITVAFTSPVSLVGNGFAVLDPQNDELAPFAVTDDDTVFRLRFDPPLAGGTAAVRYEVRAEDGHVLTGNFVFVVNAPAPTTTPTSAAPSSPAPSSPAPSSPAPSSPAPTDPPLSTDSPATTSESRGSGDVTVPPATSVPPNGATDDDSPAGFSILIALAAAATLAVGGVLLIRSRTAT